MVESQPPEASATSQEAVAEKLSVPGAGLAIWMGIVPSFAWNESWTCACGDVCPCLASSGAQFWLHEEEVHCEAGEACWIHA